MTKLGIMAESRHDVRVVCELIDRLIVSGVDWIEPELMDSLRRWCGIEGEDWLDVHHVRRLARERKLPVYGHFKGEPGAEDAPMFRAAFMLFAEENEVPAAVVASRDIDGKDEKLVGFEQARVERNWPFEIIPALARPEVEAWRIAAWRAEDDAERAAQKAVRSRLGFDPTTAPERLTPHRMQDKKDAKRVLAELTGSGRTADERWSNAPLDLLERRGQGCGLTDCIRAVKNKLIGHVSGRADAPRGIDSDRPPADA